MLEITYRNDSRNKRKVPGLRESSPPSEVKVFKTNADGTPGRLLRVEKPVYSKLPFNRI